MKSYLKILFFALLAAILFHGCGTEVEPENPWKVIVVKNPKNPYDNWGYVHNEGLVYIEERLKNMDLTGLDSVEINAIIMETILKFSADQEPEYQDPDLKTAEQLELATRNALNHNLNHLSPNGVNYFRLLETHMGKFQVIMDIVDFQNKIIDLETQYQNEVVGTDLTHLLRAASIARYSSAYWHPEYKKLLDSKNPKSSVWTNQLFKGARIELAYADTSVPKKDPGSKTLPAAIASSARSTP